MPTTEVSSAGRDALPSLHGQSAQLGHLAGSVSAGGLVLGATTSRGDIMIDLIRAVPTRALLLCDDPWLARLITIRIAGMGANVVVATDRADAWEQFVNVIGGQKPIASVRVDHVGALPAPSVGTPLVVVDDTHDLPPETYAPRMGWQSTVHVRTTVSEHSRALVDASHVVMVCRLGRDAAVAVSSTLGLGEDAAATVANLPLQEVLVIADLRALRASVTPTRTERRMLNGPDH